MSIASLGVGGSVYTPTLLSTSDVPCNKKMLHLRKVVRAASLRTLLPRKLIRKFRRLFAVAPMTRVFLLLGLRAVSGRISCSHQHMRPCTLLAFPHFPRQCEGATPDATQSRPSCQNKMLTRKHQQGRPSALEVRRRAHRSQACMQTSISSLHTQKHSRKVLGAWRLRASFLPLRGTKEVSGFCGGVLWSRFRRRSFLTRLQWGGGVFSPFKFITLKAKGHIPKNSSTGRKVKNLGHILPC